MVCVDSLVAHILCLVPDHTQNTDVTEMESFNWSPSVQNGRHFAGDNFRCIFVYENVCIFIKISLKFNPKGPIDIEPKLIWIIDKPLSQPMPTRFTDAYMRRWELGVGYKIKR